MNLIDFLIQAVASLLPSLLSNHPQRYVILIPGGILGMAIWLLYYILKGPTNVIIATFIAAIVGSCYQSNFKYHHKTPTLVFLQLFLLLGSWIYFLSDYLTSLLAANIGKP